jgi:signal transduction histidine kinase/CheY-like chemotaxis protein
MPPPPRSRTTPEPAAHEKPSRVTRLGAAVAGIGAKLGLDASRITPLAGTVRARAASVLRSLADRAGGTAHAVSAPEQPVAAATTTTMSPPSDAAADAERIRAAMDLAIEFGNVGIYDANLRAGNVRYNSQLHAIYGRDMPGSSAPFGAPFRAEVWNAAVPPEDMPAIDAAFGIAVTERRPVTYEHRVIRPSGEVRRVRSVAMVLNGDDGRPHRAIGTTLDITEERALSHELELERERLVLATRIAGIGVWGYDIAADRYVWDERMHELYGRAPRSFRGEVGSWLAMLDPGDRERVAEGWQYALAERTVFEDEWTVLLPEGGRRRVRGLGRVVFDAAGAPIRAVGCNWDVTQERELGETLRRAKDAADDANRAKSAFLANMSHEIRTPMNAVLGMAELALDTELTPQQRDFLTTIHASAESLLVVLADILDFSKIEAGKLDVEPFDFDLRCALAATLRPLSERAQRKGIELAYEVEPDVPQVLHADWHRIRQIVVNLVGNAVKFTPTGRVDLRVRTECAASGGLRLRCVVADTGIGIAEPMIDRIFSPFEQGDPAIHARFGGTGLGLAISNQLVELLGGELLVGSAVGEGSTFTFTVPVELAAPPDRSARPPPQQQRATPTPPFAEAERPLVVLVAEDNVVNQRVIGGMLVRRGHQVVVASDGAEALRQIAERPFDVVLMDIEMPEMDGLEAIARIREAERETGRRIPIIALTAHAMSGDRERFLGAGADDYLTKPLRADALFTAVEGSSATTGRDAPSGA